MSDITPPGANGGSPQSSPGGLLDEPRSVGLGRSWGWLVEGFSYFRQKPLSLVVMGFLFCVLLGTLSAIPLLSIAVNLVLPIFIAGMILASEAVDKQQSINVNYLYKGFSHTPSQLMLIGVFIGLGMMLIFIIALSFLGGAIDPEAMQAATEAATQGSVAGGEQAAPVPVLDEGALKSLLLAFFLLMFPLFMGVFFAIPLVVFHGLKAFDAIKKSYQSSVRNIGAVGLFYVLYTVLIVAASFPMSLGVAQAMQGNVNAGYLFMALIAFAVLVPVIAAASYVGYKETLRS